MTDLGHFYAAFEERYRGTFQNIKARATHYVPAIQAQGSALQKLPALDLGCGRGEWLELLRDSGIEAFGVDQNAYASGGARERGLAVEVSDIFQYLRQSKPDSFRVVTAFHVIEHLPWELQLSLYSESWRVLAPGGMLIIEWPNPESLPVSALTFWLDPTHLRPVPPALMTFMAEYVGFEAIELKRMRGLEHPIPASLRPGSPTAKSIWRRWIALFARSRSASKPPPPSSVEILSEMINAGRDIALIATKKSALAQV